MVNYHIWNNFMFTLNASELLYSCFTYVKLDMFFIIVYYMIIK